MSAGGFWIVGCGNMGGAMLRGWIASGMDPAGFTVIDPGMPPVPQGVVVSADVPDASPETLMLAVKPQMLSDVAPGLAKAVDPETRLLSILAGVEAATLRTRFPQARKIVRVMPNTPAAIRKGVLALHGEREDEVTSLMARLGTVEWIADEAMFDAVTALSGSGPAFLYRFIDALAAGGVEQGLPADQALRLAVATVEGAALLAASADEDPGTLADRVASPGGSTREGLNVLDAHGKLAALVSATLAAATRRNAELAHAARS